jgi:hypothetical protein
MHGRACGSGCMLGAMYQSFRQINEPTQSVQAFVGD